MTEELKQKAEEYAINMWGNDESFIDERNNCKQDYIAGATENGIQWHDLRKDPNDLPKGYQENTKFLCSDTEGKTLILIRYGSFWQGNIDIIAWCEIPQFKE